VRFGLFGINFGACADPEVLVRVARAAEESGFESVWTGEHVAMPIHDNPVPTPPETPFLDSLVALTTVAAHTRRVRLGTGILVLPHHNPVLVAKALASLDVVSDGRLIAGFAAGYVEREFAALGVDFGRRGAITDDYLAAIRTLWTDELPRFAGRFAAFDDIRFEPKPVQRPHPPIIVGGHAAPALRRAARFGDGWYGFGLTVDAAAPLIAELRRLRAELGRRDAAFEISLTTFERLDAALVARAAAIGVDRLIVYPLVPASEFETTVRALGATLAGARGR
jgi:probable F420-dependent oxidoreductase